MPIEGLIYKSSWNKDTEYLFISDDIKVLVRCNFKNEVMSAGCIVKLKSKLKKPESATNPGAFDYRMYLYGKGVTFYTYAEAKDIEIIKNNPVSPIAWGAKVRLKISNILDKYLDQDKRALVIAVMTGDTGGMQKDFKSDIQLAGLSHLMAVSGSHVIVFMIPFKRIFKNRYLNIWLRNILLIVPLLCFLYITDVTPSVFRSVMSVVISILAVMLKRKSDSLNTLGLTGTIQLVINPYVINDTGFILSYSSVFSIILILPAILKYLKSKGIYSTNYSGGGSGRGAGVYDKSRVVSLNLDSFLTGISVNLGILPFMCSMFNRINFIGVIFTCVASPVASLILIVGYLLCAFSILKLDIIAKLLSYIILTITFILEKIIHFASILPSILTSVKVPSYSFVIYFLYYIVLAILVLKCSYKKVFLKRIYTVRLSLLYVSILFILLRPCSTVIFYDVGQGNCIYIETKYGVKGLIDAGEGFHKVSELLLKKGVLNLDFIIVSHGHSDHVGGMYHVIDSFKIKYMFVPDNEFDIEVLKVTEYAISKGIKVIKVSNSTLYEPDSLISSEILFYSDKESLNNSSLMVKLEIEQMKVLITSDIEMKAERYFVQMGEIFDCDILQVAHHGSDTSTTNEFLYSAKPEIAIISVGLNNKFGHPKKVVLDRLNKCEVYRTDIDGAVIVKYDGRKINVGKFGDE